MAHSFRPLILFLIIFLVFHPLNGKMVNNNEPTSVLSPSADDSKCCYLDGKGRNISTGDGMVVFNDHSTKGYCHVISYDQNGFKQWEDLYNGLNGSGMWCSGIEFVEDGFLILGYPKAVTIKVNNDGKEQWRSDIPGFSTITGINEDNFHYPNSYYFTVAQEPGVPTHYGYMFRNNGTIAEINEFHMVESTSTPAVTSSDPPLEPCILLLSFILAQCFVMRKKK